MTRRKIERRRRKEKKKKWSGVGNAIVIHLLYLLGIAKRIANIPPCIWPKRMNEEREKKNRTEAKANEAWERREEKDEEKQVVVTWWNTREKEEKKTKKYISNQSNEYYFTQSLWFMCVCVLVSQHSFYERQRLEMCVSYSSIGRIIFSLLLPQNVYVYRDMIYLCGNYYGISYMTKMKLKDMQLATKTH